VLVLVLVPGGSRSRRKKDRGGAWAAGGVSDVDAALLAWAAAVCWIWPGGAVIR
jgi:hypothetical protein